jgi:hypothetical protein
MDLIELERGNEGPNIEGTNFNSDNLTRLSDEGAPKWQWKGIILKKV